MKKSELDVINIHNLNFFESINSLGPYEKNVQIAVGVSGGSDSLALTLLLHQWTQSKGGTLYAVTIDHQLRTESEQEAIQVTSWLKNYNIQHIILKANINNKGNLSETARLERYRLLTEWCSTNHIFHLFIGHTLDDQAENFIIRSSRGSGLDGLSQIKYAIYNNGVRILRPLLNITKKSLQRFLETIEQPWIEDATNHNLNYLRVRARNFLNSNYLEEETLIKRRLQQTSFLLYESNQIIIQLIHDFIIKNIIISPDGGYVQCNYINFLHLDYILALKILAKVLILVGGLQLTPRLKNVENLYQLIIDIDRLGPNTFGHTQLYKNMKNNLFYIVSEKKAASELILSSNFFWLNKFKVYIDESLIQKYNNQLFIGYFTKRDYLQLEKYYIYQYIKKTPKFLLFTLPVIRHHDTIISIPYLKFFLNNSDDNKIKVELYTQLKI